MSSGHLCYQESDGYLNYVEILYCHFGGNPQMAILAMSIFLVWLCILFIGLAISADDYFCPNLASISKTLRWVKSCETFKIMAEETMLLLTIKATLYKTCNSDEPS